MGVTWPEVFRSKLVLGCVAASILSSIVGFVFLISGVWYLGHVDYGVVVRIGQGNVSVSTLHWVPDDGAVTYVNGSNGEADDLQVLFNNPKAYLASIATLLHAAGNRLVELNMPSSSMLYVVGNDGIDQTIPDESWTFLKNGILSEVGRHSYYRKYKTEIVKIKAVEEGVVAWTSVNHGVWIHQQDHDPVADVELSRLHSSSSSATSADLSDHKVEMMKRRSSNRKEKHLTHTNKKTTITTTSKQEIDSKEKKQELFGAIWVGRYSTAVSYESGKELPADIYKKEIWLSSKVHSVAVTTDELTVQLLRDWLDAYALVLSVSDSIEIDDPCGAIGQQRILEIEGETYRFSGTGDPAECLTRISYLMGENGSARGTEINKEICRSVFAAQTELSRENLCGGEPSANLCVNILLGCFPENLHVAREMLGDVMKTECGKETKNEINKNKTVCQTSFKRAEEKLMSSIIPEELRFFILHSGASVASAFSLSDGETIEESITKIREQCSSSTPPKFVTKNDLCFEALYTYSFLLPEILRFDKESKKVAHGDFIEDRPELWSIGFAQSKVNG